MTRLDTRWRVQPLQRCLEQPQPAKRQGRADPRPADEQPLNNSAHHDVTLTSVGERKQERSSAPHAPEEGCWVVCVAGNGQMAVQASQWFHFTGSSICTLDWWKGCIYVVIQYTCGNLLSWGWARMVYYSAINQVVDCLGFFFSRYGELRNASSPRRLVWLVSVSALVSRSTICMLKPSLKGLITQK